MKEIKGVSHPIPTEYAERIYNKGKTVFVSKSHLGRVSKGDKFIIYESRGAKAYTGWGDIVRIIKMKPDDILKEYKNKLMVNPEEFKKYAKGKVEMNVIEFENFKKFKIPIKPNRFVSVGGKYIYDEEFKMINENI